jgi:N-acetylmuramoyl-L-alanine amidase
MVSPVFGVPSQAVSRKAKGPPSLELFKIHTDHIYLLPVSHFDLKYFKIKYSKSMIRHRFFSLRQWFCGAVLVCGLLGPPLQARPVVVLDPGHGGSDSGAYWGGVREKKLTLSIAQRVESVLQRRGIRTAMTRRSDRFVSLQSRAAVANGYRSAVLVSIHCNADPKRRARGIETFYTGTAGYRLACQIHKRIDRCTLCPNRGVKRRGLTVLSNTRGAAALVECGFMSSPSERRLLSSASYQQKLAQAIADGITASLR